MDEVFTALLQGNRGFIQVPGYCNKDQCNHEKKDNSAKEDKDEDCTGQFKTVPPPPQLAETAENIMNFAQSKKVLVEVMQSENAAREKKIQLDEKEFELLKSKGTFELDLETSKLLIESTTELQKARNDLEILKIKVETKEIQSKLDATPKTIQAITLRQIAVKEGLNAGMSEHELNSTLATLSKKFASHRVGDAVPEGQFGLVFRYDHDAILDDFKREFAVLRAKQQASTGKPPNQPSINVYMTTNR